MSDDCQNCLANPCQCAFADAVIKSEKQSELARAVCCAPDPRPDKDRVWLRRKPRREPIRKISEEGEELALLMLWHGAHDSHEKFYEVGLILAQAIWGTFPMDVPQYVRLWEHNAELTGSRPVR